MKLSNYSIMLPIGELRVAENPNFTPGELYRWTDAYTKKSYVLELRAIETVTLSEFEKVVTCKPVKEEEVKHRRRTNYGKCLSLNDSQNFRDYCFYWRHKTATSYQEIAEATGININTLRTLCTLKERRVTRVIVEKVTEFLKKKRGVA